MRRSSLDAVIPVLRQLILAELLVRAAGTPLYRGELAARLGVSPSSLQRPLSALAATGILKTTQRGRQLLYEPEPTNPLIPELAGLLRKTRGLLDVLRDALDPLRDEIVLAFVFGSMASGSERPGSDVDLLVIGKATLGTLTPALARAGSTLGREVNAIAYSVVDLRAKIKGKSHFLLSVLDKPRLFVAGNEHELESILERRTSGAAQNQRGRIGRAPRRRAKKPR